MIGPSFSTSSETVCRLTGSKLPKEARRKKPTGQFVSQVSRKQESL